jgi:hypothetical protein
MSTKKPSETEDEYFAREEATRLHNLAVERKRAVEQEAAEQLKKTHWMHCPKCGFELGTVEYKGIKIDRCFHCGGTWLDKGELEQVAGQDRHLLDSIVGLFRHTPKAGSDIP